jgi:tRNA(adenine34) deaminase
MITPELIERFMEEALLEARRAALEGEVPVGAVIARDAQIVGRGRNRMETGKDATGHAEIEAIREAGRATGNWRLDSSLLCVTLEPCTMCVGAALLARIPLVVFGAPEPRTGALGSVYDLSVAEERHLFRVIRGIRADECAEVMREFFERRRKERSSSRPLGSIDHPREKR